MMEWLWDDPNVQALIREWMDKGRAKAYAEGRVQQARAALHRVLTARSLSVTEDVRARIDSEFELARLRSWLDAAATASTIGDVFTTDERLPRGDQMS